jgi:GGDEF domain-containing protein
VAIGKPLTGVVATLPITVSIGVALHTPTRGVAAMADVMMRQADAAMYTSKRNGRNRTTVVEV